jgi:hypothetical protein
MHSRVVAVASSDVSKEVARARRLARGKVVVLPSTTVILM